VGTVVGDGVEASTEVEVVGSAVVGAVSAVAVDVAGLEVGVTWVVTGDGVVVLSTLETCVLFTVVVVAVVVIGTGVVSGSSVETGVSVVEVTSGAVVVFGSVVSPGHKPHNPSRV
jgi:hypothetical protein